MAAINIGPEGKLGFGNSSTETLIAAVTVMSLGVVTIVASCIQFRQQGGCEWKKWASPEQQYLSSVKRRRRVQERLERQFQRQ